MKTLLRTIGLFLLLLLPLSGKVLEPRVSFDGLKVGQNFPVGKFKAKGCFFQPLSGEKLYIDTIVVEGEKKYHLGATRSGTILLKFFVPGTKNPAATRKGGWSGTSFTIKSLKGRRAGFDVTAYDINNREIQCFSEAVSYSMIWLPQGTHKVKIVPRRPSDQVCVGVVWGIGKAYLVAAKPSKVANLIP